MHADETDTFYNLQLRTTLVGNNEIFIVELYAFCDQMICDSGSYKSDTTYI